MVYNTYADHNAAERIVLEGDQAIGMCETLVYWNAAERQYDEAELGQRRITVYRSVGADGSERTLWAYGLAGYEAGTAIILDSGEAFHIEGHGPSAYVFEDVEVEVVDRGEVPTP